MSMTFNQFLLEVGEEYTRIASESPSYRLGQCYMDVLSRTHRSMESTLLDTECDAYYDDSNIPALIEAIRPILEEENCE